MSHALVDIKHDKDVYYNAGVLAAHPGGSHTHDNDKQEDSINSLSAILGYRTSLGVNTWLSAEMAGLLCRPSEITLPATINLCRVPGGTMKSGILVPYTNVCSPAGLKTSPCPARAREDSAMNQPNLTRVALAALIVLCLALPAQAGLYISGDFGINFGSSMTTDGHDTDRASICDEYINPNYASVTTRNCNAPNRGATSLWKNRFGSDEGPLFALAIGFDMPDSMFRTELEYFYRDTGYDETSNVTSTGGDVFAKLGGELETATETIDSVTSHNLFANLYVDFDSPGRLTPYIGLGIGLGFTEMDYGSVWARNIDPAAITTGGDQPNAAVIKANLAGSTTTEHEELDDTVFGYQLIAGVDYMLTDHLVVGAKARWVEYDSFKDGDEWNTLRSHTSNVRKDGSEPVVYDIKVDDMEMFAVSLTLKYEF